MLEGWSLGRPSVALRVNPSGLLGDGGLGMSCGGDLDAMAAAVRGLLRDCEIRSAMGDRGRLYAERTHAPERACEAIERLILE